MGKGLIIALGVIGVFVLSLFVIGGTFISVFNMEVSLRTAIEAKISDNKSEFDNLWKKIDQIAQVTEAQKNALNDIIQGHAKARSGNGNDSNLIMKWVQESVPNIDLSTFNNLQNIIVGSRDGFTMRQKELLDLKREHDKLIRTFPSNIILGMFGKKEINVTIITSTKTERVFETGKDDDVSVFPTSKSMEVEKK